MKNASELLDFTRSVVLEAGQILNRNFGNNIGKVLIDGKLCSIIGDVSMDSFIAESSDSRFQGRLLIASTDRIGTNADRILQRHEVVRFLLEDFRTLVQALLPESDLTPLHLV